MAEYLRPFLGTHWIISHYDVALVADELATMLDKAGYVKLDTLTDDDLLHIINRRNGF